MSTSGDSVLFPAKCGDGDTEELLLLSKGAKNNYTRKPLWTLCAQEIL